MSLAPAAPPNFSSLLMWSPGGPLGEVYEYLPPKDARKFSGTCKKAREIYISEKVQKALVQIHFPAISHDSSSFRRLFLKASIAKGPHAETEEVASYIKTFWGHKNTINVAKILADGRRILSGSLDGTLKIWDLNTTACLKTLSKHNTTWGYSNNIGGLQLSADGTKALTISTENSIKLWDLVTGACLHTLSEHEDLIYCLTMNADGTRALSGSRDRTLKLWDLTTGKCLHTFLGHSRSICCLQMSADGKIALSGSADFILKLWNLNTGECLHTLEEHLDWIQCLWMKADGTRALSVSWEDKLRVWDLSAGQCLFVIPMKSFICLDASADGTRVLFSYDFNLIQFWDLSTGECLHTLSGHRNRIYCLQMSEDKRRALSGSMDNTIRLWDLVTGVCLKILTGHTGTVYCLQISADGTRALSGSLDKTLKLWDLTSSLPVERVSKVAQAFFENSNEAKKLFLKLPLFVQEHIAKALYNLHIRLGKKRPSRLFSTERKAHPDINYGKKALFGEGGVFCEPKEKEEVFADYMKQHFLSDVAEYLKEIERQGILMNIKYTENLIFKETLKLFDQLPPSIKKAVYRELYKIKQTAKAVSEKMLRIHGTSKRTRTEREEPEEPYLFGSQEGQPADFEQRIEAIANVMGKTSNASHL